MKNLKISEIPSKDVESRNMPKAAEFNCKKCPSKFKSVTNLNRHNIQKHNQNVKIPTLEEIILEEEYMGIEECNRCKK